MAQDSQISYKDRLTRRQNLENEYGNQIERESEMVQDFIDLLDTKGRNYYGYNDYRFSFVIHSRSN